MRDMQNTLDALLATGAAQISFDAVKGGPVTCNISTKTSWAEGEGVNSARAFKDALQNALKCAQDKVPVLRADVDLLDECVVTFDE